MLELLSRRSPCRGEQGLDLWAGDQACVEDCLACCRPTVFELCADGEQWPLDMRREDE